MLGSSGMTINDEWYDYNLWLERQGLHDEEPPGDLGVSRLREW